MMRPWTCPPVLNSITKCDIDRQDSSDNRLVTHNIGIINFLNMGLCLLPVLQNNQAGSAFFLVHLPACITCNRGQVKTNGKTTFWCCDECRNGTQTRPSGSARKFPNASIGCYIKAPTGACCIVRSFAIRSGKFDDDCEPPVIDGLSSSVGSIPTGVAGLVVDGVSELVSLDQG